MKKSRNIPAAICFALALIFLALACVGAGASLIVPVRTSTREASLRRLS